MLEARKNSRAEKVLEIYFRNLVRRRFAALHASNIETIEKRERAAPVIFYSNHSSWWDGVFAFVLWRALGIDCFVMMEEKHLAGLPIFRRAGAFSVVREKPREAARSVAYAARLLKEKQNRAVWLFPQGEILPNDVRPLKFFQGVTRIVEKTGNCVIVPAAMRLEFLGDFKPEAFVKFGTPETLNFERKTKRKDLTEHFAVRLTRALDEIKDEIVNREIQNYRRIV